MPLHDHFHPPLSTRRHWQAFHNAWATYLASDLNQRLPEHWFAEPNVQFGIEIDVATWEETADANIQRVTSWQPPDPVQTVPFSIATDHIEVSIFSGESGPTLVGAIELVSPANKDRVSHRGAFVSKCETLLHQGIGLMVIDVVTDRRANLHAELLDRIGGVAPALGSALYAVAYRPIEIDEATRLDVWEEELALQRELPTLPLWLRGGPCVPLDLEQSYDRTCREQRLAM